MEEAGVFIARVEHRKDGVGQVIALGVRHAAPHLVNVAGVIMARRRPTSEEIEEQRHGSVHDAGLTVPLDEFNRAALDAADGRHHARRGV